MKAKKRCVIGILSLNIIMLCFIIVKEYDYRKKFNDYIVSAEQFEEIIRVHNRSERALFSGIIFNESPLFMDHTDGIFYYSMCSGDASAYNPMIQIIPQDTKVNIAIKETKITDDLIRENMAIDFVVYTDSYYVQYQLKCTTLPIMNINFENEITEEDVRMEMKLFDNRSEAGQRMINSEGFIHIRGASTKLYPKLGYKISLVNDLSSDRIQKNKCSLLGMRQDDDWILYAAYNDQEKIRNVFSSNLWTDTCGADNTFHIENGMRYEYLELFLNGQYWGLYALGYPVDDLQMDTKSTKECIYKKRVWDSEASATYEEDGKPAGYEIVSNNRNSWTLLDDFCEKLSSDDTEDAWYYSSIDLENAVDYMLFINLIQGTDNVDANETKNMLVTVKLSADGTYKYLYTPWDLDIAWGNIWASEVHNMTDPYAIDTSANILMESGPLYQLLMRHDETAWVAYLEKYEEFRKGLWSNEAIANMLNKYEGQIFNSGAYRRDMDRWPNGSYIDPELGLSVFREYVLSRLSEMDAYYERVAQVRQENAYIIRSAQYKYFRDSDFIIKMGERYDEDAKELLEYIGISIKDIPKDCEFILYDSSDGRTEYRADGGGLPIDYEWSKRNDFLVFFKQSSDLEYRSLWLGK